MTEKAMPHPQQFQVRRKALEIVAQALGARCPDIVVELIGLDCPDVPAAVAALRRREPGWFEPLAGDGARAGHRRGWGSRCCSSSPPSAAGPLSSPAPPSAWRSAPRRRVRR